MKQKIIITTGVEDHLDFLKTTYMKACLSVIDSIEVPDKKDRIRRAFLDNFNNYHRDVIGVIHRLFEE